MPAAWDTFKDALNARQPGDILVDDRHAVPLTRERYTEITPRTARTAFVDAGSAAIITLPHTCLAIIRLCGIITKGTTRTKTIIRDGFVTMQLKPDLNVTITSDIAPTTEVNATDPALRTGQHRATFTQILDLIRTETEIAMLAELAAEADTLVRDGTLTNQHPRVQQKISQLADEIGAQGKTLLGLAKTNTTITTTGATAIRTLLENAPTPTWKYDAGTDGGITTRFIKLHPKSRHAFQTETIGPDATGTLIGHANDATFPGYPYQLILADRLARITEQEAGYWRAKAQTRFPDVTRLQSAVNAHELLG